MRIFYVMLAKFQHAEVTILDNRSENYAITIVCLFIIIIIIIFINCNWVVTRWQ